MNKEIIGFINKNNDTFSIKEDPAYDLSAHKVGTGHENKIAIFTQDGDLKYSDKSISDLATDIENKLDKVNDAVANDFVALNSDGTLKDSGKSALDFAPATGSSEYASSVHNHNKIFLSESDGSSAKIETGLDNITQEGYIDIELKNDQTQNQNVLTKTAQITMSNIEFLKWLLTNGIETYGTSDDTKKKLVTKGSLESDLSYVERQISNLGLLFQSLNSRVSTLETPVWSETGIDITGNRYSTDATTNTEIYNTVSIGDQIKVVITYQGNQNIIYVTAIAKRTVPNGVQFDQTIYPSISSGGSEIPHYESVIMYLRIS